MTPSPTRCSVPRAHDRHVIRVVKALDLRFPSPTLAAVVFTLLQGPKCGQLVHGRRCTYACAYTAGGWGEGGFRVLSRQGTKEGLQARGEVDKGGVAPLETPTLRHTWHVTLPAAGRPCVSLTAYRTPLTYAPPPAARQVPFRPALLGTSHFLQLAGHASA